MSKCFECDYESILVYCETCKYFLCRACNISRHLTAKQRLEEKHCFYLLCEECEKSARSCFCEACDEAFCEGCFKQMHKKGNRKLHKSADVDPSAGAAIFNVVCLVKIMNIGVKESMLKVLPNFGALMPFCLFICPADIEEELQTRWGAKIAVKSVDTKVFGDAENVKAELQSIGAQDALDMVITVDLPQDISAILPSAFPLINFQTIAKPKTSTEKQTKIYETVYSPNHHPTRSRPQLYLRLPSASKLSKMINKWDSSFFVKHKLKHPIYHIYNDISVLDQEGKRYMKIIQKELHIQALKGSLKHIKAEFLCSLQKKFDLSIIKLHVYIKKAVDHNIIYEQSRDFSHSHKLDFISLKGSFLFSHENFLWIVKSLFKDRIELSDSMILNRIKDVFDLELSKEFLYDYFEDYAKLKQLCEPGSLELFKDLIISREKADKYTVKLYVKAESRLAGRSVDTLRHTIGLDSAKRLHMERSGGQASSIKRCQSHDYLYASKHRSNSITRRKVYRQAKVSLVVDDKDETYQRFKDYIKHVFNTELQCVNELYDSKPKSGSKTQTRTEEEGNKKEPGDGFARKFSAYCEYKAANDVESSKRQYDKQLLPKPHDNIISESLNRKTLTTESNPSILLINKVEQTNSNININKSQSDIQIDCLNNDFYIKKVNEKERLRTLKEEDSYLLSQKALPGGQYALAIYTKYFGWEEIKSMPLGRILAYIKKATADGILRHYKTFLLLNENFRASETCLQATKRQNELINEFETQIARVLTSHGNIVSITELPNLIDKFCTVKLADFQSFGIRKLKALLELLNPEKFTLKEIRDNNWVLISHQNTAREGDKLLSQPPTSFMSSKRKRNKNKRNVVVESYQQDSFQRNMSINGKKNKLNVSTVDGLIYKVKMALFQILNRCELGIELGQLERKLSEELVSDFDYISFGYDNFYAFLLDNMSQFIEIEVKYVNKHEFKYFVYLKNNRFGLGKKNRYVLPQASDQYPQDAEALDNFGPSKNMNHFLTRLLGHHSQGVKEANTMEEPVYNQKRTSNISINFTLNQLLKAEEHQNLSSFNILGKIKAPNSIIFSTEEGGLTRH